MTEVNPELKGAVEAIIFVSEKSIDLNEIQGVLEGLDLKTIQAIVTAIQQEYKQRNSGIKLVEIAGGYQFVTSPNYANFVKKFYKIKHSEKLSMPSLETLSIIAYKQPVTKMEIESIRGVNVDGVIKSLLEKNLIRIVGRKEVVGRPFAYGTSRNFLEYFGLNTLEELPAIEEFVETIKAREAQEAAAITPLDEEELANTQENSKHIVQEDPNQTINTQEPEHIENQTVSETKEEIKNQEETKNAAQ